MFHLFSLVIISLVLIYTSESAAVEKFITGKITHVGSNNIDKNAQIAVSLQDVSLMDAAAQFIATTSISDAKTFPISYKLKYNPVDIKPHHTYAIMARITGPDNRLLFINDVETRADFTGLRSATVDIAVIRVGGSTSTSTTKLIDKKVCKPVKCPGKPKECAYGYQKKDGCEICRCNDPCNPPGKPILCGPNQRCFVDKKPDGTFGTRCDAVSSKKGKGGKSSSKAECNLPKVTGVCMAIVPRFYYNSVTKNCESFNYGGCQGNGNNFHTKAQCEAACKA